MQKNEYERLDQESKARIDALMKEKADYYYSNDRANLKRIVNFVHRRCKAIEIDSKIEIESLAGPVLFESCVDFLEEFGSFEDFFKNNLVRRYNSQIISENADKRIQKIIITENGIEKKISVKTTSLDIPIDDDPNGACVKDFLEEKDKRLIEEVLAESESIKNYLLKLSKLQQKIMKMILLGYTAIEIQEELGLTLKMYAAEIEDAKRYDKICVLLNY